MTEREREREREQKERWTEHIREVLNRPPSEEDAHIPEGENDFDINTEVPEKEQMIMRQGNQLSSLKNAKAPGNDKLNAEDFKADPELAGTIKQPRFSAVWEGEEVPADRRIPKKGALSDCNN